jgi:hypothetical protein
MPVRFYHRNAFSAQSNKVALFMAEQAQGSSPEPTEKELIAEAKTHAASRVKQEMAAKKRDVAPSSDAALRYHKQKERNKTPIILEERAKVLAERVLTFAPRSSVLQMLAG